MGLLELYIAALFLIALPSAAFNKVAAVVVGTWSVAHVAIWAGVPFPVASLAHHAVAAVLAFAVARTSPCFIAAGLFVPMVAVDVGCLVDYLNGTAAMPAMMSWWTIYSLAWAQMVILPFGNDRQRIASAVKAWREWQTPKSNMRVAI